MIVLNDKYKPLFVNDTRFFIVTGGRGSAKSFGVGTFASLLSFETGHKILFTRQTMTSAHLSIIPEFQEKIDLIGHSDKFNITKTEIENKVSGSDIIFKGLKTSSGDQTASLKSLNGVTTWILDEAEELTDERTFDKINLSIRQKGRQNRVILILNPATKVHWIFKRFFEDAGVNPGFNGVKGNVTYIHTDYRDNLKHLDQSFIDEVKQIEETNPFKYKHVVLGGWLERTEGVILTDWSIGEFKEHSVPVYGQDFGFSVDPTTLVKTSIDKTNKIIYVKLCYYKTQMTTTDIASANEREAGKSMIIADSAEPRLISELKGKGNNVKEAVKGAGSVSAGIARLQDYHIVVDPESLEMIKEFNNYSWNDKKSGTPIDLFNHTIDPLRYAIDYQLENVPIKRAKKYF